MFTYSLLNSSDAIDIEASTIHDIFVRVRESVPHVQQGVIHVAFLSDDEIRTLNHQYRGKDSSTDVLSFHYFDDFSELGPDDVAGEIILSESSILRQAQEHGHSPEKECLILILHGVLHILGYDHETDEEYEEMSKYESELRNGLV